MKKNKTDSLRYLKKGGWRAALGLAVLAAAICVALAVNALGGGALRRDITRGRIYTLSDATRALLAGLDEEIELIAVSDGAPEAGLLELLSRYEDASPHVRARTVTTAESAYYMGAAQTEGSVIVSNGQYEQAFAPDELTAQIVENRQVVDEVYRAESLITNSIAYVTADLPLACVMSDHAEAALEPGLLEVLARNGYHPRNVYLTEKCELPEGCRLIVCNVPMADFSDEETELLLSFLETGGGLVLVTSSQIVGQMPNLQRVAAAAGMACLPGVVLEMDAQHVYNPQYPYFLLPSAAENDLTESMRAAGIPALLSQAHGIEAAGEGFISLLETTDASYLKVNAYADGNLAFAEGDRTGPISVAAAGETPEGGKVFWVASSQCLVDQVDSMVLGANYRLTDSVVAWMAGGAPLEDIEIASPSVLESAPEIPQRAALTALLAALPILPLIGGIVACARRSRREKSAA